MVGFDNLNMHTHTRNNPLAVGGYSSMKHRRFYVTTVCWCDPGREKRQKAEQLKVLLEGGSGSGGLLVRPAVGAGGGAVPVHSGSLL